MKTHARVFNWIGSVAALAVLVTTFQNCSDFVATRSVELSSELPLTHPDTETTLTSGISSRALLGDKFFVRSVFEDVFASPSMTADERNGLNYILATELENNQSTFGRACDVAESGTQDPCHYILPNMNLRMVASTSSSRAASKIQACRRAVSHDTIFRHAVDKVKGRDLTPNKGSIEKTVELFYRGLEDAELEAAVGKLEQLDLTMARASEPINDRWRMIFLTVCESPGWETL